MVWNILEHEFYDFPYIGNFIIPTDELFFFFRGVGIPPTSIWSCDVFFFDGFNKGEGVGVLEVFMDVFLCSWYFSSL